MNKPPVVLLPREAREQLMRAAQIRNERVRRIAIDTAIDSIRAKYPQHFQPQPVIDEEE